MPTAKLISVGQLIDHAWEYYRAHLPDLVRFSAWLLVIAVAHTVAVLLYPLTINAAAPLALAPKELAGVLLMIFNTLILGPVVGIWVSNALITTIDTHAGGKRITGPEVGRRSWKLFWPRVLVTILVGLVFLACFIPVVPAMLAFAIGELRGSDMLVAWSVPLLLPGILLTLFLLAKYFVTLAFVPLALVADKARGMSALTASHLLVRGRWWSVFVRLVVPKAVFALVSYVIFRILILVFAVVLAGAIGQNALTVLRVGSIVETILIAALAVFFNPLYLSSDYILYDSLKETRPKRAA